MFLWWEELLRTATPASVAYAGGAPVARRGQRTWCSGQPGVSVVRGLVAPERGCCTHDEPGRRTCGHQAWWPRTVGAPSMAVWAGSVDDEIA